jgi:uncharacterized protein YbaP (TraB family)
MIAVFRIRAVCLNVFACLAVAMLGCVPAAQAQVSSAVNAAQQMPVPSPSVQEETPAPIGDAMAQVPAPPQVRERGVLFRVTPPKAVPLPAEAAGQAQSDNAVTSAPKPSYLLGTIHFGTPQEQGVDDASLQALLEQVETFANEVDMDTPWVSQYDAYRWLPPELSLELLIGRELVQRAQTLLPALRLQDLQRMKPWAVLALLEARGEHSTDTGMDIRLQRMARASGKRMLHLETLEQQLQALDCVPAEEHAQVLRERVQKSWVLRVESAEAMAFYRARDLGAWLARIDRMEGLEPAAQAIERRARVCLLEERNARWIGPLETLFQDGPALVAVGAVHLPGPDGLIARLRRDGYLVEAVPF